MSNNHFQRILSIENGQSTNATNSHQYVKTIQQAYPDGSLVSLQIHQMSDRLNNLILGPDTLICIAGGDGSVNGVVQTLLESSDLTSEAKKTPILPLWGGNASDLAHMLNGRPSAEKCKTILEKGSVVPIYPLRCELQAPGSEETTVRLALGYVSLGVTAQVARQINDPTFRNNRWHKVPGIKPINEVRVLFGAMQTSGAFSVEQNGQEQKVFDWIIGKGPRMARHVKLPVKLTDRAYYQSVVPKQLPQIASRLGGMVWGSLEPTLSTEPITLTTKEPVWAQFDGEPMRLAAGTKITVSLNPEPFYALTTTLQESDTLKA